MAQIKPVAIKLKLSQAVELFQAYQAFGGFNRMSAKDEQVVVPYDIGGMTRIAIALNATTLRPIVDGHTDALKALRAQHLPDFDPKTATTDERLARIAAAAKFEEEAQAAGAVEIEVKQRMITLDELKLDKNPIDPNVILLLAPVLLEDDEDSEEAPKPFKP